MTHVSDIVFALPEVRALLREELACARICAARFGSTGPVLALQPCAEAPRPEWTAPGPTVARLHVRSCEFAGDVRCLADALPWEDDSFRLILAQHAAEALDDATGLDAELARVLAPGGSLLLFGFNPTSPWRPWWRMPARRGLTAPRAIAPRQARRRLRDLDLDPVELRFLGSVWPTSGSGAPRLSANGRMRGAWLLIARKRRQVLTPLRIQPRARQAVLGPRLAGTPTQRACA